MDQDCSNEPTLWTVQDCANYLKKTVRWVQSATRRRAEIEGSIPHIRVGVSPRFIPDDIATWAKQGCPPAATYKTWQETEERRRKRM